MHPLLINIGPIPVRTYGFMIAIGFLVAVAITKRLAMRAKLDVEKVLDLAFWCLLVGFAGARFLYIITQFHYFLENPLAVFKVWEGGLVFLGGPIAVIPFFIWYVKKNKLPVWKTLDVGGPALTIAHAFGRFGCLAAGCCYGKPTGTDFGIKLYSDLVDRNLQGIPLHPTQLYEASALFILFFGLLYVNKKKVFDGQVALTYFLVYPLIRSLIEIFRGDVVRGFVIDEILSTSQFISLIVFLIAAVVLYYRLQQVKRPNSLRQPARA
jgi:phosphatidylglycerol:prolipoprotein diacylglycerol transferase